MINSVFFIINVSILWILFWFLYQVIGRIFCVIFDKIKPAISTLCTMRKNVKNRRLYRCISILWYDCLIMYFKCEQIVYIAANMRLWVFLLPIFEKKITVQPLDNVSALMYNYILIILLLGGLPEEHYNSAPAASGESEVIYLWRLLSP